MLLAMRRLTYALAGFLLTASCASEPKGTPGSDPATENYAGTLGVNIPSMIKVSRDLYFSDVTVGSGAIIADSTVVSITYTGWLPIGTQVQTNVGKAPLQITVGRRQNIAGWDIGLVGMRVGGTRLLAIGSALGYGPEGVCAVGQGTPRCTVPQNSTLVYSLKVVSSP